MTIVVVVVVVAWKAIDDEPMTRVSLGPDDDTDQPSFEATMNEWMMDFSRFNKTHTRTPICLLVVFSI